MRVSLPINTLLVPLPAKTLPAAQPNLVTNSGLIAEWPTLPRIPSVPKYLRSLMVYSFPL